jgi:hypothetical protein
MVKTRAQPGVKPNYSELNVQNPLDLLASLRRRATVADSAQAVESSCPRANPILFVRDLACWDLAARVPTRARYLTVFDDKKEEPHGSQLRWLRRPHI